ncbi:Hypp1342 [Branchiostoma lanceolatum]|uniref:Hypp1342 protein n=1 Tax=Branchiostoma lanceolatum TaxID=7740 RepID=A0A8K0EK44_BRALA|nr:Hypp1342 [Branchiostoma lanceolatum]
MIRQGNVKWTTTTTVTKNGKTVQTKDSGTGVPGGRRSPLLGAGLASDPMFDLGMGNMDGFLSVEPRPRRASSPSLLVPGGRSPSPTMFVHERRSPSLTPTVGTTTVHTEVKTKSLDKKKKKEKDAENDGKEKKPGITDKVKDFVSSSVSRLTSKSPTPEEEVTEKMKKTSVSDLGPVQVFLSYQWDHQKQVIQLHDMLEEKGYSCWMDIKEMGGGDKLYAAIDKGMRQAKVVISCVTPKYTESANCRNEVALAHSLNKTIVPVLLEKTSWPPEGPMAMPFAQLLYIDFTKESKRHPWQGPHFDELMTSVEHSIKG